MQTVFQIFKIFFSQLSEDCRTQHPDVITAALEGHEEFYEGIFFEKYNFLKKCEKNNVYFRKKIRLHGRAFSRVL